MAFNALPKDVVDWTIFNELVSMDEDDPDFSKSLILQFIDQAETTFAEMQSLLDSYTPQEDSQTLTKLDSLGHFLKGSSAALGLQRIAWICERIQNLGRKDEKTFSLNNDNKKVATQNSDYIMLITDALAQVRNEFKLARCELSKYYKTDL